MPAENNLYEYAVLRYVPSVEREEFVNIGLIMMCKRQRWIRLRVTDSLHRLNALGGIIPEDALRRQLKAFSDIAEGIADAGPIASWPVEERFRWLTAEKSACLRTSPVHPGLTPDLAVTFESLFESLVS